MAIKNSLPGAAIAYITWSGNGTGDRAIAHTLGKIPKVVITIDLTTANITIRMYNNTQVIYITSAPAVGIQARLPSDTSSFYVGGAGSADNTAGHGYKAVALA